MRETNPVYYDRLPDGTRGELIDFRNLEPDRFAELARQRMTPENLQLLAKRLFEKLESLPYG